MGEVEYQGGGNRYTWHQPDDHVAGRLDGVYKPISWPATYYYKHTNRNDHSEVLCDLYTGGAGGGPRLALDSVVTTIIGNFILIFLQIPIIGIRPHLCLRTFPLY